MLSGIYKITSPKKKVYIGSSINIEKRISYYKTLNCSKQVKLYNSLKKHGWDNHKFEILELCNKDNLYEKERYYGELYNVLSNNGLNLILPKTTDFKIGVSQETRKKMSESKKGSLNTFYGKKHKLESKLKISQSKKGLPAWNKGIKGISNVSMSKKVINLETGILYDSCKECCEYNTRYKYSTLRSKLNGREFNNTFFRYA